MEFFVEITPTARERLLEVLMMMAPTRFDALLMAATYCDEVERVLRLHRAPPPDALLRDDGRGASWWLFARGVWFGFTRRDERVGRWPFRRVERTFTVFSTAIRPPAAGTRPPLG